MGSREGGLAAAKTLKQKYGDTFYANIGRKGGSAGSAGKGFDHPTICNCTLIRGDSKNWKAYQASLKPYPVGGFPDYGSRCPNCHKYINYVNAYDDGETWMNVN